MTDSPLVYVAEDDEAVRELIQITLERAGYAVETAATGRLTPERLRTRRYALMVLDVRMPGETGLDALRTVKASEAGAHTPVLMLTGEGRLDRIAEAMRLGASGYLMKPFDPEQLLERVRQLAAPTA